MDSYKFMNLVQTSVNSMLNPAVILASRKGLRLRNAHSVSQFYLIDKISGFPAVNVGRDTLSFTLEEAVEFLDPSATSWESN